MRIARPSALPKPTTCTPKAEAPAASRSKALFDDDEFVAAPARPTPEVAPVETDDTCEQTESASSDSGSFLDSIGSAASRFASWLGDAAADVFSSQSDEEAVSTQQVAMADAAEYTFDGPTSEWPVETDGAFSDGWSDPVNEYYEPNEPVNGYDEPDEPVNEYDEPNEPVNGYYEPNEPVNDYDEPISGAGDVPFDPGTEPQPDEQVVTVQPGDTLTAIAREYFGDTSEAARIALYNDVTSPNLLKPGQTLLMPPDDFEISAAESRAFWAAASTTRPAAPVDDEWTTPSAPAAPSGRPSYRESNVNAPTSMAPLSGDSLRGVHGMADVVDRLPSDPNSPYDEAALADLLRSGKPQALGVALQDPVFLQRMIVASNLGPQRATIPIPGENESLLGDDLQTAIKGDRNVPMLRVLMQPYVDDLVERDLRYPGTGTVVGLANNAQDWFAHTELGRALGVNQQMVCGYAAPDMQKILFNTLGPLGWTFDNHLTGLVIRHNNVLATSPEGDRYFVDPHQGTVTPVHFRIPGYHTVETLR